MHFWQKIRTFYSKVYPQKMPLKNSPLCPALNYLHQGELHFFDMSARRRVYVNRTLYSFTDSVGGFIQFDLKHGVYIKQLEFWAKC